MVAIVYERRAYQWMKAYDLDKKDSSSTPIHVSIAQMIMK